MNSPDDAFEPLGAENERPAAPRPQIEIMVWRALQLKCPRCGAGKLYRTFFRMNDACPSCNLRLKREPGYYLGATYINYGATVLSMTAMFLFFRFVLEFKTQTIIWPLFGFSVILPLIIFRHARALWLAIDCQFDRSVMDE